MSILAPDDAFVTSAPPTHAIQFPLNLRSAFLPAHMSTNSADHARLFCTNHMTGVFFAFGVNVTVTPLGMLTKVY